MRPGELVVVALADVAFAVRHVAEKGPTGTWTMWAEEWLAGSREARSPFAITRAMRCTSRLDQARATLAALAALEWAEAQSLEGRKRETALGLCAVLVRSVLGA